MILFICKNIIVLCYTELYCPYHMGAQKTRTETKNRSPFIDKLLHFLRRYWPLLLFALVYVIIFRKVFFSHLVPFPGDLLASWFFPYNSGGWVGYSPWTT